MKLKFFILFFSLLTLLFAGCSANTDPVTESFSSETDAEAVSESASADENDADQAKTDDWVVNTSFTDIQTVISSQTTDIQATSDSSNSSETNPKIETQTTDSSIETERQEVNASVSADNTADNVTSTNVATEDTSDETPSAESQPASPYDVIAKEGAEELLAERMIYYINLYREEEGNVTATVLPGLTELCEYRSRQLINNFAHDARDIREAATSLQYGRYTDPALWGIDDEQPYYDPMTQEAIGKYSVFSPYTVDAVAQKIASAFRKSDGHWAYLGASSQINKDCEYIGAGATFYNGTWFVCVSVNDTDKYG